MMRAAGYRDAWNDVGAGDGFTCCHAAGLRDPASLDMRIDLVLFRGAIEAVSADVVGEAPDDRTASGLWPADHAGVLTTLRLLNPKF